MSTHWKAVLGVILIFIFGFFSGVICTSIYAHRKVVNLLQHPGEVVSAALEKRLTAKLDLDPSQKQQVHDYFLANLEQRKELQKTIQPEVQALNRQTFMEINAVLRPEQVDRFHQNLEEFRKRYAKFAVNANVENPLPGVIGTNTGSATPPPPK